MKIKGIVFEDFVNYKKPSMFIIFPYCSFKCDKDSGRAICQNGALAHQPIKEIDKNNICQYYLNNSITEAIVCGGLEPMDSKMELLAFIDTLRNDYKCNDDIVIYTGYTEEELENGEYSTGTNALNKSFYQALKKYSNIIVKFGRFIPNREKKYDVVLGVTLASDNQYAKVISINDNTK